MSKRRGLWSRRERGERKRGRGKENEADEEQ